MSEWSVKGVRTFKGMEGSGFSCSLYCDGVKVADVSDYGTGGPVFIGWLSKAGKEKFLAYVASLPSYELDGRVLSESEDTAVCRLVDEFENDRRFKRICKTKVLFRLPTDPEGSWRTLLCPFTQKAVDQIHRKYGEQVEILNYKYGELK